MRKARWLASWRYSQEKPVFYHCISRVVERRFAFGPAEKEKFRTLMRMQEKFTGCRVVAYCVMSNHFHLLLEVPPVPKDGISDALMLRRLSAIYSEAHVAEFADQLAAAKADGNVAYHEQLRNRYLYRMHDLGEFMKGLLQRFTQWFNRKQLRTGRLWEDRFKSVIVEDGIAAKTMAAYIDLNPVRAAMVKDPADYRWSSYGEAMGAGKTAQAGQGADSGKWKEIARKYRHSLLSNGQEILADAAGTSAEVSFGKTLSHRIRYFTDGAVIGSRSFVNEAFENAKHRFGIRRKDGARRMKGNAAPLSQEIWSCRDLRKGIA